MRPGLHAVIVWRVPREAFVPVPWMPIASALAGPIPGLCLLHQMTLNISFQPFQAAGWEPRSSFAGFIHLRAFQRCGKTVCLQIGIVGHSAWEAVSQLITLLLTGKLTPPGKPVWSCDTLMSLISSCQTPTPLKNATRHVFMFKLKVN